VRDCGGALPEATALERAVAACVAGECAALVTAPIHKRRLLDGGFGFVGHTEFLADRCDRDVVMAFGGGKLRVALLTTHLPLREVADAIHTEDVPRVAALFADGLRRYFGIEHPRLALCGLNPHAGEEGKLGAEDAAVLAPGVALARQRGIDLDGPLPADSLMARAARGGVDGVIACFHDQGLTAVKAVDFGSSVNFTLGLPFLRTSPDHGTAHDIAWTGRVDPSSMISALRMAVRCASGS
jgi:4-hydroxythreonine-4-phosphate dehydrogenase